MATNDTSMGLTASSLGLPATPNPSGVINLVTLPGAAPYATQEFVYEVFNQIKDAAVPPATDHSLGGVIVGSGLAVGADGRIDVVFPSHADYLTKTDASSTYAKLSALTDYLTKTDAETTYAKASALADYLTKTDAETTYVTKTYVDDKVAEIPAGTTDYNDLGNKPSINGIELSGNKTSAELKLVASSEDDSKKAYRAEWADYATLADKAAMLSVSEEDAISGVDIWDLMYGIVPNKRDKTDNIAAKDSAEFTEWKFHCDEPDIQAALDANPPTVFWEVHPIAPGEGDQWTVDDLPDVDGYETDKCYFVIGPSDKTTLSGVWYFTVESGVGISITATRTKTFTTTKEGEPYVTLTGVKAITAPGFHKLAPEISEGEVTLKPVDGEVNYVTEKAEVNGSSKVKRDIRGLVCLDFGSPVNGDLGLVCRATFDTSSYGGVELRDYHETEEGVGIADFSVSQDIPLTVDEALIESLEWETERYPVPSRGEVIGYITPDTTIEMYLYEEDLLTGPSTIDVSEVALFEPVIDDPFYQTAFIDLYFYDGCKLTTLAEGSPGRDVTIAAPASTDHARQFSLTLETDAGEEKDVTWEGADEIIEAFPGASKLAVGTTVWDVKEVAPGKMLVNRAPGASGGSVTLTSESGSNYELKVNNSGELEVKES